MKVRSIQTGDAWLDVGDDTGGKAPDPGAAEARRVLSSAVRSQNLAVLAGLGTSLCVTKGGRRLASHEEMLEADGFYDLAKKIMHLMRDEMRCDLEESPAKH